METKTGTCKGCGAEYPYEPIDVMGVDFGQVVETRCPACAEAAELAAAEAAKAARLEERRANVLRIIPPDLLPVDLDPLGTDIQRADFNLAMWAQVREWRPGPHGHWLGLHGPPGECKTRILALMATKILMQGQRLFWTSAVELYDRATYGRRSPDQAVRVAAREHLEDCMRTSFLVLDDLGKNEWGNAFESTLFTILDHRKNYRLPILWSSNVHPEQLHTCLSSANSGAIIGRLIDRCRVVDFTPAERGLL